MQQLAHITSPMIQSRAGGRVNSPELRYSLEQCSDFEGLEETVNRYDLLLLVKKIGKTAGFTQRMIGLLDYYMAYTRDIDWEEGSQPIVYQSVSKTALDLGVSERQIQRLEQALFDAGALTWQDSGNHRRYGQRCNETGHILYAYGVDLTPLAYLREALETKLHEKQRYDKAWMETKRQISWYRRQIKASLAELYQDADEQGVISDPAIEAYERRYNAIAMQIRTSMPLESLKTLLDVHKTLHNDVIQDLSPVITQDKTPINDKETSKESSKSDENVSYYKYTTQESFNKLNTPSPTDNYFQKSRSRSLADKLETSEQKDSLLKTDKTQLQLKPNHLEQSRGAENDNHQEIPETDDNNLILKTGLQNITWKQVLNAASDRYKGYLPLTDRQMSWNDIVEAGYRVKSDLKISQRHWAEACELLGRAGASICVLLTDQAALRESDPVRVPAAYFKGMINKAHAGELRLHKSIFGILKA